jgi:guanylate kinase
LKRRIDKATYELTFEPRFDITIINNNLEEAQNEAQRIVLDFVRGETN